MTSNRFIRKEWLSYRFVSNGSPGGMIRRYGWLQYRGEVVERESIESLFIEGEGSFEERIILLLL